jgi:hypothetical protein
VGPPLRLRLAGGRPHPVPSFASSACHASDKWRSGVDGAILLNPVDKGGPLRAGYLVARKHKAVWRCFLAES